MVAKSTGFGTSRLPHPGTHQLDVGYFGCKINGGAMLQPITIKLKQYASLGLDDVAVLESTLHDQKTFAARTNVVREGTMTGYSLVLLSGWACCYKVRKDGSRQITSFLLPGDSAHLNAVTQGAVDYSIGAVSTVSVARVPWSDVMHIVGNFPTLRTALMVSQIADESLLRSAVVSMGRRNAEKRVAYQLCELWCRAAAVGLIDAGQLEFPVTQADFADRIGLTAVHVNRVLQRLRQDGLVDWKGHRLSISDFSSLARAAEFNQAGRRFGKQKSLSKTQHPYKFTGQGETVETRLN